jgi:hypothetical protein
MPAIMFGQRALRQQVFQEAAVGHSVTDLRGGQQRRRSSPNSGFTAAVTSQENHEVIAWLTSQVRSHQLHLPKPVTAVTPRQRSG